MEKRTMHTFGENVKDCEGELGSKLTGGASLTTEYLTLPINTGLRITNKDLKVSYCKILIDKNRMISINNHLIQIPVDTKYDMDGTMISLNDKELELWKKNEGITNFLDISLKDTKGGGGAHNSAYCSQVYLNSSHKLPLEVRLVVPHKSSFIEEMLPKGLIYDSIIDSNDDSVPSNLNIKLAYGKKLTFRSKSGDSKEYDIDTTKIKDNDIIIVDSIKNPTYINAITNVLDARPDLEFYLAATDSMMNKLGRKKVYDLALRSDLYVSNSEEFNMLMKKDITDAMLLADVLLSFQDKHKLKSGKPGTIAITYGENGSVICDKDYNIYFQPVAMASRTTPYTQDVPIVNTNGCGDAYFSMMAIGHAVGYDSTIKLNYANAAGHLCAFKNTATDAALYTNADIKNYRKNFSNAPIYCYNIKGKKFEPMGL
ncbi:MAG: hypothetical protein ACP5OA_03055 [Candidatus Woesearchaeota archaeon]